MKPLEKNMAAESTIDWPGASGKSYRYWFLSDTTDSGLSTEAGNYMFVRNTQANLWVPIYIGVAVDLRARVMNHEVWAAAAKAGASRVMAHLQGNEAARIAEERDLIARWNPSLNTHHRTAG
jgi:hypothetical protein